MALRSLNAVSKPVPPDPIAAKAILLLRLTLLAFPILLTSADLSAFLLLSADQRAESNLSVGVDWRHLAQVGSIIVAIGVFRRWLFWPVVVLVFLINLRLAFHSSWSSWFF